MTTEEIVRIINGTSLKTLTDFVEYSKKVFPDIDNYTIIHKQDMGLAGILATARFNHGKDEIIVKGFLYPNDNWTEETHGYIIAKKI